MKPLELRKKIKAKKPDFIRQDAHKKKRLGKKWRKPKGLHSKMRLRKKGHRKNVSKGYGAPKAVRGLHPSGLAGVLVSSVKDLGGIKKESEGVVLGKMGLKKRIETVKEAERLGIKILNVKAEFLKEAEESIKKKKEEKGEKRKEKVTKEKERVEKAKERKKEEKVEKSEEELKMEKKKELDEILTKRE